MNELVAFYGTLMSDMPPRPERPDLSARLRLACDCRIQGDLLDLGAYPGLIAGGGMVLGELWRTTSTDALEVVDAWEAYDPTDEHGSQYLRRAAKLVDPDVTAWVYVWNGSRDSFMPIADGDWRSHTRAPA